MVIKHIYRSPGTTYSEAFKRKIIDEYLSTGRTKQSIQKKYRVKSKSAIVHWMRQLGYSDTKKVSIFRSIKRTRLAKRNKSSGSVKKETSELEARIKELEKELEDERLRSAMYNRMIEIAETEFKLPLRKKPNTK